MLSMRLPSQNCVGVTSVPSHPQELASTDSDSPGAAPTNPLFSAFYLGGGRASNVSFAEWAYECKNDLVDRIKLLTLKAENG